MKTLVERINEAVITLVKERVEIEKDGFFYLWQLENGLSKIKECDLKGISEYVERQKSLGYSEKDLTVNVWTSTYHVWYNYIGATVSNKLNGSSYRFSDSIKFVDRDDVTKKQLEEADLPIQKLVLENRFTFLNKKEAATEFIEKDLFYQNNLKKMHFDKETHDYVLSVKKEIENNKKMAIESSRNTLMTWALENGSELLKLRIKHDQNWLSIAETEWAMANSVGFSTWGDQEEEKTWNVYNSNLYQLKVLEAAKNENPEHEIDIIRCRFAEDEYQEALHRTYLRCEVKTPVGKVFLYREIDDVSETE